MDPFRPGLADPAEDEDEFEAITRAHLDCVLSAIRQSNVFIFTLGLTEAWVSRSDGAVYPACPGTIAGTFDPSNHQFVNFQVGDLVKDLIEAIDLMRSVSPELKIILTVSPVPLVATATSHHVYRATSYSKAALRAAAEEACQARENVFYFPAYEIVTGPQNEGFFGPDRRSVTPLGLDAVMDVLFSQSQLPEGAGDDRSLVLRPDLMRAVLDRECEEAATDQSSKPTRP